MLSFRQFTSAPHLADKKFHSLMSRRVLSSVESDGSPSKKPKYWEKHDVVHADSAKVFLKHGFLKRIKKIDDSHTTVEFHNSKLRELNNHLELLHGVHAMGYNKGSKK